MRQCRVGLQALLALVGTSLGGALLLGGVALLWGAAADVAVFVAITFAVVALAGFGMGLGAMAAVDLVRRPAPSSAIGSAFRRVARVPVFLLGGIESLFSPAFLAWAVRCTVIRRGSEAALMAGIAVLGLPCMANGLKMIRLALQPARACT